MRWCVWLALAALSWSFTSSVRAQEGEVPAGNAEQATAAPEDAEAARVARERFREGMGHFEARRFREAIHAFQLAAQAVPSADLWFNIARAYEELHDPVSLAEAVEHYRMYLRDRVDPPDREAVEQRIASLEERVEAARQASLSAPSTGTLRVDGTVEGATVTLDERPAGETPVAAPLTVSPGAHALELSREGFLPFRAEVDVQAGSVTAAYARLSPATEYRSVRGRRIWTWVLTGLAAAGLGASLGLGVHARSEAQTDLAEGRRWAAFSDYALGGAITLGVAAFVVGLFEGRSLGTERVTP
ncbi:MAG: PEGA domain-containing protein [Sandaracinus sp.]|nr:PEGA domain-containing protein [Sandaracinus sp.]MCB9614419.1 PEGA domain-containing protein [Sandaracinus sp.]MCB9619340.1 PEGA domain-containing protein [Sandaracinus sp.]MCB9633630.1 PEGA domain-containing protein [Sandaracinus sp.]